MVVSGGIVVTIYFNTPEDGFVFQKGRISLLERPKQ